MSIRRHKPEEIVTKLRQVDILVGQDRSRVDAIREASFTEQTYYLWCKQYGGMETDQLKELKRLQKENERLHTCVPAVFVTGLTHAIVVPRHISHPLSHL